MLNDASRNRDFPALSEMTYLNTAAEGIPPRAVLEALAQYGRDKLLGMDGRRLHEVQWHAAREQIARAFGLQPAEIGICSCTSEAFNMAALALRLRDGDEIVINDLDFPAGASPWLAPGCPAKVRLWKSRAGALHSEDLIPLLGPRTRLVSTSLVSFYNGFRLPLREVIATVRRHSPALIALDVTQALGRIPLDLSDVDLIVSSTHKWILATHGGGLVGVPASRAVEWTVPAGGWFNLENAFEADRFEGARIKPGAGSFGVGMPNYPAVYAIRAALEYIQGVGISAIDAQATPLVSACNEGLKKLPIDLLTPDDSIAQSGIIAFRHAKAAEIHQRLHDQGIHVMHHAGRLRVALHGYNTDRDVETLLSSLQHALKQV